MHGPDVRWTHQNLRVSLKNNVTTCGHGRCQLLADGSLRFSAVQSEDAGRYRLQVFDRLGIRVQDKNFELQVVPGESQPNDSRSDMSVCLPVALTAQNTVCLSADSGGGSIMVSILCCFFLLLFFIVIILLFVLMRRRRRRRSQRTATGITANQRQPER